MSEAEMVDKRSSQEAVVSKIRDGDSVLIGGWGDVRKPMSLVKAIARAEIKNLTVYSYAAMDLDLLVGTDSVKQAFFGFVACDGGAPISAGNINRARCNTTVDIREMDEYMFACQFKAAAERIPFYPVRGGIGSDVLTVNSQIKTIVDPYGDETLVAVPACSPDHVLIHVNEADQLGNAMIAGDSYFDGVFAKAGKHVVVSCERVVPVGHIHDADILGIYIDQVVESKDAARPGSCYPDYDFDAEACLAYSRASRDPVKFANYIDQEMV